jgi:two-component system response regulator
MSRQTPVILLVEDSQDDADLTLRAFRNSGMECKIVLAHDGNQALDYLFARGEWTARDPSVIPALILLDLKLPGASGLEILRQIRQNPRTQRIPVVVMSCSTEESDISASYAIGANSYVRKPVDFVEFAKAIGLLSRYWLQLNQSILVESGRA